MPTQAQITYRKYELTGRTNRERICWLDRNDLQIGQQVKLANDYEPHWWTIKTVSDEMTGEYQWRTYKIESVQNQDGGNS